MQRVTLKRPGKEEFERLYVTECIPVDEIASRFGVTRQAIFGWTKYYDVALRGAHHSIKKDDLVRLYKNECLTMAEIADRVGCSETTIWKSFDYYGLKARSNSECRLTRTLYRDPAVLKDCYVSREMSCQEIAILAGVDRHTVADWMREFSIPLRSTDQTSRLLGLKQAGDRNPSWRGGRIKNTAGYILVYQPNHPLANNQGYVRRNALVACEKEDRILEKGELVHHIDMNTENDDPGNLYVCKGNSEHRHIHHEMELIAAELVKRGVVGFMNGHYVIFEGTPGPVVRIPTIDASGDVEIP
jgi:predicted DNA-binding protein YlxM (UPF0122 family)